MTTRRFLLLALGTVPLLLPLAVFAQARKARPKVGYLDPRRPEDPEGEANRSAFLASLREHGWVDGENVAIEYRSASGKPDRHSSLATELVRLNVDVIVTAGDQLTMAVLGVSPSIPIVTIIGDPVATGLVTSLARPGINVTGVTNLTTGFPAKWLELLKEWLPRATRFAALRNLGNPVHERSFAEIETAAANLGVRVFSAGYRARDDLEAALASVTVQKAHALLVLPDPIVNTHHSIVGDFVTRNRMPSAFLGQAQASAGGLFSYGPSRSDQYRRIAAFVDKILRGARPSDLPIEQPTKFELVVNLRTTKALGIAIPNTIRLRADRVIE